eukprot:3784434-Pleurochrysis_carterae.AAC.2
MGGRKGGTGWRRTRSGTRRREAMECDRPTPSRRIPINTNTHHVSHGRYGQQVAGQNPSLHLCRLAALHRAHDRLRAYKHTDRSDGLSARSSFRKRGSGGQELIRWYAQPQQRISTSRLRIYSRRVVFNFCSGASSRAHCAISHSVGSVRPELSRADP